MNLQLIKSQLAGIGLDSKTTYCTNGQSAYDAVVETLQTVPAGVMCPVSFMLLDQNMPLKTGI